MWNIFSAASTAFVPSRGGELSVNTTVARQLTSLFLEHCSIYSDFFSRRHKVHAFIEFQKMAAAMGRGKGRALNIFRIVKVFCLVL